jgi:hypothetical protein
MLFWRKVLFWRRGTGTSSVYSVNPGHVRVPEGIWSLLPPLRQIISQIEREYGAQEGDASAEAVTRCTGIFDPRLCWSLRCTRRRLGSGVCGTTADTAIWYVILRRGSARLLFKRIFALVGSSLIRLCSSGVTRLKRPFFRQLPRGSIQGLYASGNGTQRLFA